MPNTQNNQFSSQNKQPGQFDKDKAGGNTRKDEPAQKPGQSSGQRAGGGM
jgi:hypothetical protein